MIRDTRLQKSFLSCNILYFKSFSARAEVFLSNLLGYTSNISVNV